MKIKTEKQLPLIPQIGDKVSSLALGLKSRHTHIWWPCVKCGNPRWVTNITKERNRACFNCMKISYKEPRPYRMIKTITVEDTPNEGDCIRGKDINKCGDSKLYEWAICPVCKIGRWRPRDIRKSTQERCTYCANRYKKTFVGEQNSQWKGGFYIERNGYKHVILRKDDPYYPMANGIGYVAEHRLVMAKHLGRCLSKKEIVHHKHTKYPSGSIEDKQDNRIENLELISTQETHHIITVLERQVDVLKNRIDDLEKAQRLNSFRIRELESKLLQHGLNIK